MLKKKILIGAAVSCSLVVAVSVFVLKQSEGRKEVKKGNHTINVIEDTKTILADQFTTSKIDAYEGILGYDWLGENQILVSRENTELPHKKTKLGEFEVQNLYSYDLNSKKEKSMAADTSEHQKGAIASPDKKHIFYANDFEKEYTGYITDSEGNIKIRINAPFIDGLDLAEAHWINNEELIMPYTIIKGFYIAKTDGTSTKIENVENEIMTTEDPVKGMAIDPLKGMFIMGPVKVGDYIYYRTQSQNESKRYKMMVYDVNTKKTKELIKEKVSNFQLSPDKKHFIMRVVHSDNVALVVTDLEGKNRQVLDKGYIFGENWSPDGTKVSYISNEKGNEGVYVVDVQTKKKSLLSKGRYYTPTAWSPSGKKLMVHSTQQKDGKSVDITKIINLE